MSQYRVFIKDCLDLSGKVKSDLLTLSFDVRRDLLEKSVSTFNLEYIDVNIEIGDLLGLYDQYGTIYYIGVIDEIDTTDNQITCTSNISYFKYLWLYNNLEGQSGSTEELLKRQFENVFKNTNDTLMTKKYGQISINKKSDRLTYKFPTKEENETLDFEDFLYECYESFGIVCDLKLSFNQSQPVLTIDSTAMQQDAIKIGNNYNAIQNFNIETDTFENNKLIIYSQDGTTLRGTYYGTTGGITTNASSPLRLKKINNVIAFSDDDINLIVQENLQDEMFNHKITFDLLLNNSFYDFFTLFKLGCPVNIWHNGVYFSSVFTGYQFIKEENEEISQVSITCGKVRNTLTSKILRYVK